MKRILPFFLPVMTIVLTSCQVATETPKVTGGDVRLSGADSAAYLDGISSNPTVTEAEAMKGILLVLDEKRKMNFAEAVAALQERKIVASNWDFQADKAITRGRIAYMAYQAFGLKGGLTLWLTGPSQRYCLKELQFRGFMGAGISYNTITGMEYVSILGRIDEFRQTGKVTGASAREGGQE